MESTSNRAMRLPRMCFYTLGLGFYWTWVALAFFSTTLYNENDLSAYSLIWGLGTLVYAILLTLIALSSSRLPAKLPTRTGVAIGSGALMSIGSLLIVLSGSNNTDGASLIANVIGMLIFNVGSAFFILSWAQKYCELSTAEVFTASCLSYIIMSVTHTVVSFCDMGVTAILVVTLPLLSSSMQLLASRFCPSTDAETCAAANVERTYHFKILLPLVVLFFYGICEEILRNLFATETHTALTIGVYYDIGGGIAGVVLLLVGVVIDKRHGELLSVTGLRGILVLMALAFLLGSMLRLPVPITYLLYSVGFHMLRVFAWVYVIQASQRGALHIIPATAITQATIALSATPIALLAQPQLTQTTLGSSELGTLTTGLLFIMIVLVSLTLNPVDLKTTWGTVSLLPALTIRAYDENDLMFLIDEFRLTPREAEIALLLANGRSMPRIKDDLCVSLGTVQTHVNHIYRKLDVHSRQEFLDIIANKTT